MLASALPPSPDWRFEAERQPLAVRVHPRMVSTSNDAAVAAVVKGFGLTPVISYMVAPQLAAGRLKTVLAQYESAPVPVNVVHQQLKCARPSGLAI